MKKRRLIIIAALVLMVAVMAGIRVFRPSRHQPLREYVEELKAGGERLTFRELIASLSPHPNDSLAVLTNVVRQLGPPPAGATNIDVMHFIRPGRAQVAWKLGEPTWAVSADHSPQVTWTDVGNHITRTATLLAELRQAMKQPAPNAGYRTNNESPTPFRAIRSAANWLASEALWNLHQGRRAETLASIQGLTGLADLHREEYELVSQMTRVAVADLGLKLTWEALQTKEWSDEQLLGLQTCWEGKDFLEAAEKGMVGERCLSRETFGMMQEKDPSLKERFSRLSNSYYGRNLLDADLLFRLRHVQGYVEQIRALRTNRAWSEVSDSLDQLNARIDALTNSPQRIRYLLTLVASPNFKPAVRKGVQIESQRRLAISAIALNRYEHKYGQFPASLDGLAPEFLPAVPRDCMNGQPLRYQLKGKDGFILYSVGEDGHDNSGDPNPCYERGWQARTLGGA